MNILNLNFDQSYLVDTLRFGGRGLGQALVDVTKIFALVLIVFPIYYISNYGLFRGMCVLGNEATFPR